MDRILHEAIPAPGPAPTNGAPKPGLAVQHATAPDGDRRPPGDAARAWAGYLITEGRPEAQEVFRRLELSGAVTPALRIQWVDHLVGIRKEYAQAAAVWAAASSEPGYPDKNRICNSRFSLPPSGGRMDWNIAAHPQVGVDRSSGLVLTFPGTHNIAYAHLTQQTFVPAGRWRFTAEAEGNLSTDQRPYFRIHDADPRRLDISTPMAPERMAAAFTVPPGGSWVTITLLRNQSEKFDNKIQGTLRLRSVNLSRADGPQ